MKLTNTLLAALQACVAIARQPSAPHEVPAPLRDLNFGDVNFLHTTDTHGWHGGHLQEASYSADWGDYIDFSNRLREKLESEGKDLIVVDSGDRIEGNGLYDSDNPKGLHTLKIFRKQHMDIICSGNHELYHEASAEAELNVTVPAYPDSYIASNLNITNPRTGESEPLAPRYRKFTTRVQGIRVTAFGFIFNFSSNAKNTQIRFVEDVVKEAWFQEVISDKDVDLFVVVAHSGAYSPELDTIYKAIRAEHWDTPIQFFAGHEHIRAYKVFDLRSTAIASGRFLETIGFQSITGITGPNRTEPIVQFSRRYIDNNLYSFYHHTGLDKHTFHSRQGRRVSRQIEKARKELRLDDVYGCAPQNFWMTRAPFPSDDSIYTLLNDTILPEIVVDDSRSDVPHLILTNSGAIRFDIFKGPFTIDTTYIVSPFTSAFGLIKDVPYDLAVKILDRLNGAGRPVIVDANHPVEHYETFNHLGPLEQNTKYFAAEAKQHQDHRSDPLRTAIDRPFGHGSNDNSNRQQHALQDKPKRLTPGYVTVDDLDNEGDDTLHTPIPRYPVPNVISSLVIPREARTSLSRQPPQTVDLVYNAFLQKYIVAIALDLGADYTGKTEIYAGGASMTQLLSSWISQYWKDYCSPA